MDLNAEITRSLLREEQQMSDEKAIKTEVKIPGGIDLREHLAHDSLDAFLDWLRANGVNPNAIPTSRALVIGNTIDRWQVVMPTGYGVDSFPAGIGRSSGWQLDDGEEWDSDEEFAKVVELVRSPVVSPMTDDLRAEILRAIEEATQPATEHHVGSLDLSGERNRAEVASPISDEATEAMAQRMHAFAYPGAPWDLLSEESRDWCRQNARAELEAAYPAIREQVAEEIAVALEARAADWDTPNPVPEGWDSHHLIVRGASQTASHAAARIARDIGGRDAEAAAPGGAGGASGRTRLSASPSDPQAGKAGRSESGGFEG